MYVLRKKKITIYLKGSKLKEIMLRPTFKKCTLDEYMAEAQRPLKIQTAERGTEIQFPTEFSNMHS